MIKQPWDLQVKGKAYRAPFHAGAGGFTFELQDYQPASLDWVLQMKWDVLHIRPLDS